MEGCVFCKIIAGELPSAKVWDDPDVMAILDINPIAAGHLLVMPKGHYETLCDVPASVAGRLIEVVQEVAGALLKAVAAEGFNVIMNNGRCANQLVPHAHFHIVPRSSGDGIRFGWVQGKYQRGEMEALCERIKKNLQR
jgi:histidine triad (HIT) family protein